MVDVGGGQNIRLSNVLLWLCIVGPGLVAVVVTWPCLDTILDSIRWLGLFLSDLSIHVTRHAAALPGS